MELYYTVLWPCSCFIDYWAKLRDQHFPSLFWQRFNRIPTPSKNKETYSHSEWGKTTTRVQPNPFLFEILNSIYHPRARSSSTLSLLPCWGEQRGLDVVTEWFLCAAVRVRGQLREAYALLRLVEKKNTYPVGQNACDVNTGRDQHKKLLGNPTAKHLFSIFSKKKKIRGRFLCQSIGIYYHITGRNKNTAWIRPETYGLQAAI